MMTARLHITWLGIQIITSSIHNNVQCTNSTAYHLNHLKYVNITHMNCRHNTLTVAVSNISLLTWYNICVMHICEVCCKITELYDHLESKISCCCSVSLHPPSGWRQQAFSTKQGIAWQLLCSQISRIEPVNQLFTWMSINSTAVKQCIFWHGFGSREGSWCANLSVKSKEHKIPGETNLWLVISS